MATHFSIFAWRIPWTEEPGRVRSVGHKESDMTKRISLTCYIYSKGLYSACISQGKYMGMQWKQWETLFWGAPNGDWSHEIKRCLLLGRKAMTNQDGILKSRDITLLTKVHLIKAMVFPVVMYGCESWTVKKAECRRIDAFELWCWRRLLRVPWTARRSNQSILKEISPEYSLEGLMLKLKLLYFGHLMWRTDSLEKTLMLQKIEGRRRRGWQRMRWCGWHHRLNGHEFE